MLSLVGEAAGLALDLLEKTSVLYPFCKARSTVYGPTIIGSGSDGDYSEDFSPEKSIEAILLELKRQIAAGTILEFALCTDSTVKFQNDSEHRRCLAIEFQNGTPESGIYYFPLTVENGKASLGKYFVADVSGKLL